MLSAILLMLAPEIAAERPYQALDLHVAQPPAAAVIDGRPMLFYELHATNFAAAAVTLRTIEVIDPADRIVARIDPASAARPVGGAAHAVVAPGHRSVIYVGVPWQPGGSRRLRHRLTYEVSTSTGSDRVTVTGGETVVADTAMPTLSAPLRGGPWAAVYAPEMDFGHRRFVYAVSGQAHIPGRFAIDWMPALGFRPTSTGERVAADGSGADVLAVADATVVQVKEPTPPDAPASIEDETGATVVLDLGGGRYAFYEHLMPGIRLGLGQRVKRGQAIARLGATGHVSQPHLHFHVGDGRSLLASEGMPYRLGSGSVLGAYPSIDAFGSDKPWRAAARHRVDGLPAPNAVVQFD